MRYVITVTIDDIAAAHRLPDDPGACARLHGHNWSFAATIGAEQLAADMVADFRDVKAVFKALDHTYLNEDAEIVDGGHRPTTERVAEVLAARLQGRLDALPNRPRLLSLTVRETGRNEVTYTP